MKYPKGWVVNGRATAKTKVLSHWCSGGLVAKLCPTPTTPRTIACQDPLSMGFSRQKYWSCHFLLQKIFPTQGSNLVLQHCRQILYWLSYEFPVQHSFCLSRLGYKPGPAASVDNYPPHSAHHLSTSDSFSSSSVHLRNTCCSRLGTTRSYHHLKMIILILLWKLTLLPHPYVKARVGIAKDGTQGVFHWHGRQTQTGQLESACPLWPTNTFTLTSSLPDSRSKKSSI